MDTASPAPPAAQAPSNPEASPCQASPPATSIKPAKPKKPTQAPTVLTRLTDARDLRWVAMFGLRNCTVLRVLGQGSHGIVELVALRLPWLQPLTGAPRVLLAARKTCAKQPGWQRRYSAEKDGMRAGRASRSGNLVRLLAARRWLPERTEMLLEYLPMALIDDLESLRVDRGWELSCGTTLMSLPTIRSVAGALLGALRCLHAQGRLHRDLKPDNVLVDYASSRVALTDFDMCRRVDEEGMAYGQCGTPFYMAPEVPTAAAPHSRGYSYGADLYSLGCVLAQCALGGCGLSYAWYLRHALQLGPGSFPFTSEEEAQFQQASSCLPADLAALLHGLLHPNPALRLTLRQAMQHPFFSAGRASA